MNALLSNKKLLLLAGIIVFGIILLVQTVLFKGSRPTNPKPSGNPFINQPVDSGTDIKSQSVASVSPEEKTILTPGEIQNISVKFVQPLEPENIFINLKERDIVENSQYSPVDFESLFADDNKVLNIKTKSPIKPFNNYNLTIYSKDGFKLLQLTYVSDRNELNKESGNNPDLASYLPHNTASYALSYLTEQNLYVFNFIYNSSSSETVDSQYDKAKQDAIDFIKSKGFDPDSLKIEWRFH